VWEIDRLEVVKEMLDVFRPQHPGAVRVDSYFRIEGIVGLPIAPAERAALATG
jgi:hypothetical protein